MDSEKLKARLQRLLALTQSPEENEARTAAHLMVRTCREHGVTIAFKLPRAVAPTPRPPVVEFAKKREKKSDLKACLACGAPMMENQLGDLVCLDCARRCPVCGSGVPGKHGGGCPARKAERADPPNRASERPPPSPNPYHPFVVDFGKAANEDAFRQMQDLLRAMGVDPKAAKR